MTEFNWKFIARKACPGCGSNSPLAWYARCTEPRVTPVVPYEYLVCTKCGLVFQMNIMDPETMDRFYESEYRTLTSRGSKEALTETDVRLEQHRAKRVIGYVEKFVTEVDLTPRPQSWLDVGCGSGELLKQVYPKFIITLGVEPNAMTRRMVREKAMNVVESIDMLNAKYDVVSACHMLEHLADPLSFLKSLRSHVKEGHGILVIDLPHIHGTQTRTLTFTHLQAFSVEAAVAMARKAGFYPRAYAEWKDPVIPPLYSDLTLILGVDPEYTEEVDTNAPKAPKEE